MSLESVFAVISGWIVLGERLTFQEIFGCLLMFTAVILAQINLPQKN
jgi:drug/metabolite transporter (DMT)-like permease